MPCYLTIFSETGFPHAAVLLEINGKQTWLGYGPAQGKTYTGAVSRSNRKLLINNYVRYEVPCRLAESVLTTIVPRWHGKWYIFGVQDCVSFAADVATHCGLTANYVNITPFGLVYSIAHANPGYTHYNVTPYPFGSSSGSAPASGSGATGGSTPSGAAASGGESSGGAGGSAGSSGSGTSSGSSMMPLPPDSGAK